MNKKDIQSEKTRANIIKAAISLFAKNGFHNTSITEIAELCRLSKGALYWHFKDKEDLLMAVIEQVKEEWKNVLRKELKRNWSAHEKIHRILDLLVKTTLENKERYVIFIVLIAEFTEVNERYEKVLRDGFMEFFEFISQIVKDGKKEGSIHPDINPDLMAVAFMGIWQGTLLQWLLNRNEVKLGDLVNCLRSMVFNGLSTLPKGKRGPTSKYLRNGGFYDLNTKIYG
jgi:AcrR family transcriptional regulator